MRATAPRTRSLFSSGYRRPKQFPIATPVQVIDEVRRNNPDAKWALSENERAVGTACAMLADLLALDCIVLGTLAAYLGDAWVARVRDYFRDEALAVNADTCARSAARCRTCKISPRSLPLFRCRRQKDVVEARWKRWEASCP